MKINIDHKDPQKHIGEINIVDASKYFTPPIEDIRVGYELEWKLNKVDYMTYNDKSVYEWQKHTINIGDFHGGDLDNYLSLTNPECEKRVPYLTKKQIESCGFTLKHKSIDCWFQINEDKRFDTDLHNFFGYKSYNVFLNYGFHDHRLKIKSDFSGGGDFDKAETLYEGECKCINQLRQILKQTHITPFYGK